MGKPESIIHCTLIKSKEQYFCGSLVAMFHFLTPDQVGTSLKELYRNEDNFKKTGKFCNSKCSIERVEVLRAKQKWNPE